MPSYFTSLVRPGSRGDPITDFFFSLRVLPYRAKRYERLKKRALGSDLATTSAGGDGDENGSPFATPQKSRTKATTSGPETPGSTKRKRSGSNDQADSDGDDLGAVAETPSGRAKTAKARTPRAKRQQAQKAAEAIKQEAEAEAAEDVAEREGQLACENTGADEDEVLDDVIEVQLEARDMVEDADGF